MAGGVIAGMRALILGVMLLPLVAFSQDRVKPTFRLDIVFTDSTPSKKPVERHYAMLVAGGDRGKINASVRVPWRPAESKDGGMHMVALGSIMDCRAQDANGPVNVDCSFESSEIAATQPTRPLGYPPVMHSMVSTISATLALDKPTLVSTMDDPATGRRFEVQLTVSKL